MEDELEFWGITTTRVLMSGSSKIIIYIAAVSLS